MSWRREYYDYDYFPPPSRPRAAKGGIKAQSKRGTFGESWWAKRWIAVLESFHIGARLDRGRSYARRGQVLAISIDKGVVKAKVQGSQPKPYSVTITLKVLSTADWQKLAATLSQQAIYTAKLLAGEMPQDIEQAFRDAKLSLFPAKLQDLETECSCPDWSNPCKHIAAVYYLLGEEFDRNPFLIFKLRGMDRQELVTQLEQGGQKAQCRKKNLQSAIANQQAEITLPREPLVVEVAEFWGSGSLPDDVFGEVRVPPTPAALLKRLGNFPFWRGEERFLSAIEPVYTQASARGVDVFLGTRESK
ncbi:MAG TPA: SWIM zinc finger family protein [Candidatus Binatia bacterium]|nr:SWIM zinc finger family protein [Candidatus Binatia bacterium]